MNTLNYIGCKNKLFDKILSVLKENIPDLSSKSFSDLFMGTGIVSYNMINECKSILANDLETYSYVIGNAILKYNYTTKLKKIIEKANKLNEVEGLVYKYYSPNENCERMFFTNSNSRKCDAIRIYIQELLDNQTINMEEFYFLLASLLVSIDKVANTTCVYGSYLKTFKKSSLKPLLLEPIHQNTDIVTKNNSVLQEFAENIECKSDITYLDPPYNQRSYSGNYFVLNFIAKYDKSIIPKGKTGLIDKNRSNFCSKTKIKETFKKLIKNINSQYILLSYNNEGLLKEEEIKNILSEKGTVNLYKIKYNKFKAQKKVNGDHVYEYLWFVDTFNK